MKVRSYALRESDILSRVCFLMLRLCSLAPIPWDSHYLPVMLISCCIMCSVKVNRKSGICWLRLLSKSMPWDGLSAAVLISMLKHPWLNSKSTHSSATSKQNVDATIQTYMTQWFCITLMSRREKKQKICALIWQSTSKKKTAFIHHQTNWWEAGLMLILLSKESCSSLSTFWPKKVTTKTLMVDWDHTVFLSWSLHISRILRMIYPKMKG